MPFFPSNPADAAKAAVTAALILLCSTGCDGGCAGCRDLGGRARQAAGRAAAEVEPVKERVGPAIETAKEGAAVAKEVALALQFPGRVQSGRNLRRIGAAMRAYHDAHGRFPPAARRDAAGRPLLSWRVLILPHLGPEEAALYREFKLDEPWDGDHNRRLLARMPKVYAPTGGILGSPEPTTAPVADPTSEQIRVRLAQETAAAAANARASAAAGLTHYKVFTGPGTVFDDSTQIRLNDLGADGFLTFLAVEARDPSPWTSPEDLVYDATKPKPPLGVFDITFLAVDAAGVVLYHTDLSWAYVTVANEQPPPGADRGHRIDVD